MSAEKNWRVNILYDGIADFCVMYDMSDRRLCQHLMDWMLKKKLNSKGDEVYAGMFEGNSRMLPNHQAWSEAAMMPGTGVRQTYPFQWHVKWATNTQSREIHKCSLQ